MINIWLVVGVMSITEVGYHIFITKKSEPLDNDLGFGFF